MSIATYRALSFIKETVPDALASAAPMPAHPTTITAVLRDHLRLPEIFRRIVFRGTTYPGLRKPKDALVAHLSRNALEIVTFDLIG